MIGDVRLQGLADLMRFNMCRNSVEASTINAAGRVDLVEKAKIMICR